MEADWEIEVGAGSPVIQGRWPGFVDLRVHPERASQLPEATELPALAQALRLLNSANSPVWTSKCDVFTIAETVEMDPDELDAPLGSTSHAIGGYVDLLPRSESKWDLPANAAADCKQLCALLHAIPLRCCRVDLVLREAIVWPASFDPARVDVPVAPAANEPASSAAANLPLGITAYFTACGASHDAATRAFERALVEFARVLSAQSTLK